MTLQEVTIDIAYLGLAVLSDGLLLLGALLVFAAMTDGIILVIQVLRRNA